jgi:D-alanyl-D-alanine carboxypeptidase
MPSKDHFAGEITRRDMLLMAGSTFLAPAFVSASNIQRDWGLLDRLCVSMIANRITPGLELGVMQAGKLIYNRAFGCSNIETDTLTIPRAIFRIGSLTKQFTAAAVVLLSEGGRLGIDSALANFLPQFPRADEITLRQMLTHTSGLGDFADTDDSAEFMLTERADYDAKTLLAAMRRTSPLFVSPPGMTWSYSNTAYVLLGLVIEKVTGAPFGAYFEDRLFKPAGLENTAVDDAAAVVAGRASGYDRQERAATGFENASFISMTLPGAAGSMRSTAADLCRWHHTLLGGSLLRAESLKEMLSPVRLKDGTLPAVTLSPVPTVQPNEMSYGFGLGIGRFKGRRFVSHPGNINGFTCELRGFPAEQISIACLVNCDLWGIPSSYSELEALRDMAASIALGLV